MASFSLFDRWTLEATVALEPRISVLEDDFEEEEDREENDGLAAGLDDEKVHSSYFIPEHPFLPDLV